MKYMMMMYSPRSAWEEFGTWSKEDIRAQMEHMMDLNRELQAAGEFVVAEGLAGPEQARIVRARKDGTPEVTDGPYPEAKEFLGGYWILDVETAERVYEIAARVSAVPGKGGVPVNMAIEVRPILSGKPEDYIP
ncbi:MAG TPA: YciI family protein [Thermoanaerobaculia bacterium]